MRSSRCSSSYSLQAKKAPWSVGYSLLGIGPTSQITSNGSIFNNLNIISIDINIQYPILSVAYNYGVISSFLLLPPIINSQPRPDSHTQLYSVSHFGAVELEREKLSSVCHAILILS